MYLYWANTKYTVYLAHILYSIHQIRLIRLFIFIVTIIDIYCLIIWKQDIFDITHMTDYTCRYYDRLSDKTFVLHWVYEYMYM